ncbi:TetR/AcrR family transcriptional regulator [Abyssibius alkaniclasticus]|uniref:TetR/AcrR family transcriptional regulator n=1 Tax=Abyssibius alkaniclasticus TaxID=2881234 RepID=UPI0040581F61
MAKKPHHHGNLRAALIQAGIAIIEAEGLGALTLRKVAARAGVSHAAPAHHFAGLAGLNIALATQGWQLFTAEMEAHRQMAAPEPRAQLVAICEGYLAFADKHPGLFTLIFNTNLGPYCDEGLNAASDAAYHVLQAACAPFAPVSPRPGSTEAMIWALVHGLACLRVGGHTGANAPPEAPKPAPYRFDEILPPLRLK